jgi:hypothetical protein
MSLESIYQLPRVLKEAFMQMAVEDQCLRPSSGPLTLFFSPTIDVRLSVEETGRKAYHPKQPGIC